MKNFKITVTGKTGSISYNVYKTIKGANTFAKKIACEAFYGEDINILIIEL